MSSVGIMDIPFAILAVFSVEKTYIGFSNNLFPIYAVIINFIL